MIEEFKLRLRVDHSRESKEAVKLLCNAGIPFVSVPIGGTIGPTLDIGLGHNDRLYGLREIKNWLKKKDQKGQE